MNADLSPTACLDWQQRLQRGEMPITLERLPIETEQAMKFGKRVDRLRVPDIIGQPTFGSLPSSGWLRTVGKAIWGDDEIREALICVGKKSAKSAGGALLFLSAFIGNKKPQANFTILSPTVRISQLTFDVIAGAVRADPALKRAFHIRDSIKEIENLADGSKLNVKPLDAGAVAGLRGSILLDELWLAGEIASSDRLRAQLRGALAADPQAKIVYVTTVSDSLPRGMFLHLLQYARQVRDGTIDDPTFLPCIFEPWEGCDPVRDESTWPKLLPSYPHIADAQFYRRTIQAAKEAGPAAVQVMKSQFFNIQPMKNLKTGAWTVAENWDRIATKPVPLDALLERSEYVALGCDLGSSFDWTSLAAIGVDRDENWLIWAQSWCFQSSYAYHKKEQTQLDQFIDHGDLRIVEPGQDLTEILDVMDRVRDAGKFHGLGMDPYAGSSLYTPAEERGYDIDGSEPDILAIRQTIQGLNAPIQRIERQMLEGKLIADNGPALAWCVSNVLMSQVGANTKLEREQQGGKIDALAAMIDAAGMLVMRRPRVVDLAAMIG